MVKKIPNYIANQILRAADLIQQWQSQSQDSLLGYNGTTRDPKDFDIGDLTAITNGALIKDILMRTTGKLKNYSGAGALLNEATIEEILTAVLGFDTNYIEGFQCINNLTNPTYQIDVEVGKCVAKDKSTILELTSLTVADLTNHITPVVGTSYHLFIYKHSGTGVILLDFSTSLTPIAGTLANQLPNLDGTKYRRILSVETKIGSADLYSFSTRLLSGGGIDFLYDTTIVDINVINSTTTDTTHSVFSIPVGIKFLVHFSVVAIADAVNAFPFTYVKDMESSLNIATGKPVDGEDITQGNVWTDIFTQIKLTYGGVGNRTNQVYVHGYIDYRINT